MPTLKFRAKRAAVVAAATASLVGLAGCGFNAATLTQYTQAEGINLDLAEGRPVEQGRGYVKVRNLMIIAQPDGSDARLSGVLYGSPSVQGADAANAPATVDTLQSVSGRALEAAGDAAGDLTISLPQPLEITVDQPVKLDDQDITVSGGELIPGVDAELTLTFQENGRITTRVPVVDGSKPDYQTVSASPEASIPSATGVEGGPTPSTASPGPGQEPQEQN